MLQVSSSEGFLLSSTHNIEFHEISVAEDPNKLYSILNKTILQMRRLEDFDLEKKRKQTVWSMSRVISNILGGGGSRGSLPPELGDEERGGSMMDKMSFKTVFKKRSV